MKKFIALGLIFSALAFVGITQAGIVGINGVPLNSWGSGVGITGVKGITGTLQRSVITINNIKVRDGKLKGGFIECDNETCSWQTLIPSNKFFLEETIQGIHLELLNNNIYLGYEYYNYTSREYEFKLFTYIDDQWVQQGSTLSTNIAGSYRFEIDKINEIPYVAFIGNDRKVNVKKLIEEDFLSAENNQFNDSSASGGYAFEFIISNGVPYVAWLATNNNSIYIYKLNELVWESLGSIGGTVSSPKMAAVNNDIYHI